MRILFVHNIAPWDPRAGGGQKAHHEIAVALSQRDHDVRALFLGTATQPPEPLPYGVVWVPEHERLLNNVLRLYGATRRLERSWRPEAAYLSAAEGVGPYRALRRHARFVMTSHHFQPPPLLGSTAWRHPLRSLGRARKLQRFYMERHLLRGADRCTAVSEYGRRILAERGYLARDRPVTVIPNGVGSFWLERRVPGRERRGFLFVGRMDRQKGVDVLLHALKRAESPWTLDLIGEGWQRSEYQALARELGLEQRTRFLGHGDPEAIRSAMWSAGALVVPSRSENYPLVLLEGMAAGVPVIGTRVGGVPEMIGDGRSGLLVPPGSPDELARALDRLSSDASLREALARGGHRVAADHTWDRVADRIETELDEAVAHPR